MNIMSKNDRLAKRVQNMCANTSLTWSLDKSIELKYQNDTYPFVAITPAGEYRIVKASWTSRKGSVVGYEARFIPAGKNFGSKLCDAPTLREAKRLCEEDYIKRG